MNQQGFQLRMQKMAVLLSFAAVLLIIIHYFFLQSQSVSGDENWLITVESTHKISDTSTVISIQPPYESQYVRLLGRNLTHPGLRIIPPSANVINRRALRLKARQEGDYQVVSEFSLQYSQQAHFHKANMVKLTDKQRNYYLSASDDMKLAESSILNVLVELELDSLENPVIVTRITESVSGFVNRETHTVRPLSEVISTGYANQQEKALLMVALSRNAGIPARLVTGFELKDDPSASRHYWAEFYHDSGWQAYYPGRSHKGSVPLNMVAFDKYNQGITSVSTGGDFVEEISIELDPVTFHGQDISRGEWYQVLIFDRLQMDSRQQLALLMLLPLGTLICSIIRQFLSFRSYGVFTPTMLALAFIYAEAGTTMLLLFITLLLVYFGRPTFHMEMSRTPRLSIIFTLVATSMIAGVSLLDYFDIATDGQLILLPIVIITSLLDRFFSTIESSGYHTAFIRLVWTLILTISVLPVLQLEKLGLWILRYPEFHLFTLSLIIMISYTSLPKYSLPAWLSLLAEPRKKTDKETPQKTNREDEGI